ncbi:MAG: 23S rRNA (guanosine(2251)-2'-O)-methyltransferase RlmB [Clostridiales bacterium]|mgnify:CR=1 FL=1|nr:MAG: 23S rRNA (guanosine(2251)-2'-O)-methyltransferase RlmB [Clostridiales bacterium]
MSEEKAYVEGRHPVEEALASGRTIDKIYIAKGGKSANVKKILDIAKEKKIPVSFVDRKKIDEMSESHAHQGILAKVSAHSYLELDDLLDNIRESETPAFLILLDEIQDPHNLGSVLRTADASGVDAVIIPRRRSATLTPIVAKTSAGAVEYVPVCKVVNLVKTIEKLKENGVWVTGADMNGEKLYYDEDYKGNTALVIGNEGQGISRLVREKCDFLVRIPMEGKVNSLNASVSASILMYEVRRQRDSGS